MARYRGPKQKIARRFKEPIFGPSKALERKPHPPGQHGRNRRRKESDYSVQLKEKQKVKYTYGVLERQFRKIFDKAARKKSKDKNAPKRGASPYFLFTKEARPKYSLRLTSSISNSFHFRAHLLVLQP